MRIFNINKEVISVNLGKEVLTDKSKDYTEEDFPEGMADDLVERGFLTVKKEPDKKKG